MKIWSLVSENVVSKSHTFLIENRHGDVRTIRMGYFSVQNMYIWVYFAICTHGFNRIRPDIVTKRSRIVENILVLIGFFYYHKETVNTVRNVQKCHFTAIWTFQNRPEIRKNAWFFE